MSNSDFGERQRQADAAFQAEARRQRREWWEREDRRRWEEQQQRTDAEIRKPQQQTTPFSLPHTPLQFDYSSPSDSYSDDSRQGFNDRLLPAVLCALAVASYFFFYHDGTAAFQN